MEGVTDLPVRLWLSLMGGFQFAMTPFLRVTKDYSPKRIPTTFAPEISVLKNEVNYALIPQLMGPDVDYLCPVAERLLENCQFIDVNCGCPSPRVVGNGAGSALLQSCETFADYVQKLCSRLGSQRFSVKMRLGYDQPQELPLLLASIAHTLPRRLTIHGRTRAQRYTGHADWFSIFSAKHAVGVQAQIVGSGDIVSAESFAALHHTKPEKLDGFLVGRGALRNPLLLHSLATGKQPLVSRDWLLCILRVAALLLQCFETHPGLAIDLVGESSGAFRSSLGSDLEKWGCLENILQIQLAKQGYFLGQGSGLEPVDLIANGFAAQSGGFILPKISRGTLCKLKMLWNYLRTGLPANTLDSSALRASSFSSFYEAVGALLGASLPESFYFAHFECYDWIFSGGKSGERN